MSNLLKMMAGAGIAAPLYSNDVFSAYTYTGNGAAQTITNGIDLAGEGGLVWMKGRGAFSENHNLVDTTRGVTHSVTTNNTSGQLTYSGDFTSFNSDGFTLGATSAIEVNTNGRPYVAWTFRNAPNFYGHQVVVKSSGSSQTALFPELTTLGMVRVKRTDSTGSWYVWHRSLTAGKLLIGETTAAEATLGHITVSGTTVTLVNGVIADGTYLVEAWAHDASAEGIIQCGTFTTDGAGAATVELGWEPQFLITKRTGSVGDWRMADTMRRLDVSSGNPLWANLSSAETTYVGLSLTSTGFKVDDSPSLPQIYLAIRRPNKPPTVGTQVYNAIARTGTGAAATVTGVGFAPDLCSVVARAGAQVSGFAWYDRLRGGNNAPFLRPSQTNIESTSHTDLTSFNMDGISLGTVSGFYLNYLNDTYINHFFRRAVGFFDEVCFDANTANTEAIPHNLTVVPEMAIHKRRSGTSNWAVFHNADFSKYLQLNTTIAFTAGVSFSATATTVNLSSVTGATLDVVYLFATLAGISKVGSYTGTAATLQINCGFTTGARFVLIKRTDSTGDWYVWDTVRGIIAGNDPYLLLNSTAAEVTTTDYIDPYSAGFEISSTAPAAINASGGSFIYFAVA